MGRRIPSVFFSDLEVLRITLVSQTGRVEIRKESSGLSISASSSSSDMLKNSLRVSVTSTCGSGAPTWICARNGRSWVIAESLSDGWNRNDHNRSNEADEDGVEVGWLLACRPSQVSQRR